MSLREALREKKNAAQERVSFYQKSLEIAFLQKPWRTVESQRKHQKKKHRRFNNIYLFPNVSPVCFCRLDLSNMDGQLLLLSGNLQHLPSGLSTASSQVFFFCHLCLPNHGVLLIMSATTRFGRASHLKSPDILTLGLQCIGETLLHP